jgi:hypothetical protein
MFKRVDTLGCDLAINGLVAFGSNNLHQRNATNGEIAQQPVLLVRVMARNQLFNVETHLMELKKFRKFCSRDCASKQIQDESAADSLGLIISNSFSSALLNIYTLTLIIGFLKFQTSNCFVYFSFKKKNVSRLPAFNFVKLLFICSPRDASFASRDFLVLINLLLAVLDD